MSFSVLDKVTLLMFLLVASGLIFPIVGVAFFMAFFGFRADIQFAVLVAVFLLIFFIIDGDIGLTSLLAYVPAAAFGHLIYKLRKKT